MTFVLWYHTVCMIYLIIILIFVFLISCWMSTFTLLGLNVWKVQRFSLSCVERLRLMSLFAHERKRKMKVSLLLFLFSLTAATFGFKITEEHLKEKRFFFEVRNNTISSRQILCLSKDFLNWICFLWWIKKSQNNWNVCELKCWSIQEWVQRQRMMRIKS